MLGFSEYSLGNGSPSSSLWGMLRGEHVFYAIITSSFLAPLRMRINYRSQSNLMFPRESESCYNAQPNKALRQRRTHPQALWPPKAAAGAARGHSTVKHGRKLQARGHPKPAVQSEQEKPRTHHSIIETQQYSRWEESVLLSLRLLHFIYKKNTMEEFYSGRMRRTLNFFFMGETEIQS